MRNYQRTKNNPHILPPYLYRRTLYLVKDYDRLKAEWENILYETPRPDGQPRGSDIGDPTSAKAIRREKLFIQLEAIEQGLLSIPEGYRRGVECHVKYGIRFPDTAHLNTWKSWQARFLYTVAKKIGEI